MRPTLKTLAFSCAAVFLPSAHAAEHDCFRFQYVGICYWLLCTPYGCSLKTSQKYGHYNPDLVVRVTNGSSAHGGIAPGSPASPHQTTGHGQRKDNLAYKDANANGHPLAGRLYCPSAASVQPYFQSDADTVAWRWSIPEVVYPQSLVPGLREIGSWPLNTWGAVYPRAGWITQTEDPKTAAVIAQRVGDIVTRNAQPHAYLELKSGGTFIENKKLTWRPPDPLTEGDSKTGDWEMLEPKASSSKCESFGQNDTASSIGGWSSGKASKSGDYSWTLWRPYSCCDVKGDVFIGYIDILQFPNDTANQ